MLLGLLLLLLLGSASSTFPPAFCNSGLGIELELELNLEDVLPLLEAGITAGDEEEEEEALRARSGEGICDDVEDQLRRLARRFGFERALDQRMFRVAELCRWHCGQVQGLILRFGDSSRSY